MTNFTDYSTVFISISHHYFSMRYRAGLSNVDVQSFVPSSADSKLRKQTALWHATGEKLPRSAEKWAKKLDWVSFSWVRLHLGFLGSI